MKKKRVTVIDVIKSFVIHRQSSQTANDNDSILNEIYPIIKRDDDKILKGMLDKYATLNLYDINKLILRAGENKALKCLYLFLDQGKNILLPNLENKTHLLNLVEKKCPLKLIKYLADQRIDLFSPKLFYKTTLLHIAAWKGDLDVLNFFIEELGVDPNLPDLTGKTPLHIISIYSFGDYSKLISYLLSYGADINKVDFQGNTPIHLAAGCNNFEMVKILEKNNANLLSINNKGFSPLDTADIFERFEIKDFLIYQYLERISKLIKINSKDIEDYNFAGQYIVHYAIKYGHYKVVKYYLNEKDNDINLKDKNGDTPLHIASKMGTLDLVKYLLNRGADINTQDNMGAYPLNIAALREDPDIMKHLIIKGGEFNKKAWDKSLENISFPGRYNVILIGIALRDLFNQQLELDFYKEIIEEKNLDNKIDKLAAEIFERLPDKKVISPEDKHSFLEFFKNLPQNFKINLIYVIEQNKDRKIENKVGALENVNVDFFLEKLECEILGVIPDSN